tara:strand:+ start:242 stop:832 length:591 start_codon:yes stop_codon:yes gene_type:complete
MKLYRPIYILSGIVILIISYYFFINYDLSNWLLVLIVFVGISNLIYAFSNPKNDLPESKFPPGYFFTQSIKQYNRDAKQDRENWKEANKKILICPQCNKPEKILNFPKRKNATLMIYNEGKPKIRSSDGLHIYPMICFKCKTVTEFAPDTENISGEAIEGFLYFNTKKITKKDKLQALKQAKMQNWNLLVEKINKL